MAICGAGPTLMILLLTVILTLGQAAYTWHRLPSLETFSTYEDMQRYFDQRNFRSMRQIDNPTGDTYLAAFNQYNEQQEDKSPRRVTQSHSRIKREQRQLPTAPRMLRFELADAVEPSPELKQILRQYHARALKENPTSVSPHSTTQAPLPVVSSTKAPKIKSRKPRRQKRSVIGAQQPADFKVHMIPFQETDAREPDALTAQLIKKGRSLDLQSQATRSAPDFHQLKTQGARKQPFQVRIRKTKRSKRSAPQMIKFELADAKPLPQRAGKQLSSEAVPTLLTMEAQPRNKTQSPQLTTPSSRMEDNDILTGEATAETKRMYVYKESPLTSGHVKTKKSLSALPHEVQKVISQLMKDGLGGKAYVKYLPAQKTDYEHYKAKPVAYGAKPLGNYVKYINKPLEASVAPAPVQVHIQPVPVVEQLRYVYKPAYVAAAPAISQPIVVQEAPVPTAAVEEVHHTYTAELAPPPTQTLDVVVPHFRPSKPDPLLAEAPAIYGKPLESYNYAIQPEEPSPLIKIEYHAQPDGLKEHYKQLPEFQQLSTLIGKSPDDQIHGLTYLLAKEMQAKLQRQGKQLVDRPQDSTAPILFHPAQVPAPVAPTLKTLLDHGSLGIQPGRLIGMAKTKQYVPIIEPGNNDVKELPTVASKVPTPSSYIDYTHGHGLSNGYEGVAQVHEDPVTTVEHVVHHPTVATHIQHLNPHQQNHLPQQHHLQQQHVHHHGLVATVLPAELDADKGENGLHFAHSQEDKSLQQYASKYAFGYRIRDFHTGNDFGHKQNRDLHGVTRGQYHILLPDGRIQNVIYHADDTGFHADVSFESGAKH
ncbi:uncharacterized protein LOC128255449 isoform X1 [Drosophila gunungcola]|uniref:uncharacterized protein LOC128255449 isoform X1 n=1 Tax=Drosophila gunungcola TaxID=103775 RepID=UPI0022E0FC60|nr:uncharacterized protein LOC128255449 isoform X1 [Drosophila gunungcola]